MNDVFVQQFENIFDANFCKETIQKFNDDTRKFSGLTMSRDADNNCVSSVKSSKISTDLPITSLADWMPQVQTIYANMQTAFIQYSKHILDCYGPDILRAIFTNDCVLGALNIQHYEQNKGGFNWHNDFGSYTDENYTRAFAFIIYLNDVHEGGETNVLGRRYIPKAGSVLFFPSSITYAHKGCIPLSSDKYIITGWFHMKTPAIPGTSTFLHQH